MLWAFSFLGCCKNTEPGRWDRFRVALPERNNTGRSGRDDAPQVDRLASVAFVGFSQSVIRLKNRDTLFFQCSYIVVPCRPLVSGYSFFAMYVATVQRAAIRESRQVASRKLGAQQFVSRFHDAETHPFVSPSYIGILVFGERYGTVSEMSGNRGSG